MSSLVIKFQMIQGNKIRKVRGRGEVRVILFCLFSTPPILLLSRLAVYLYILSCVRAFCISLPWSPICPSHMKDNKNETGSKGRASSGLDNTRITHASPP